ncbi:uncharacterized protein LOC110377675 [Helicoverpa armigera]|uniref:uncharacterized protein LOC110377675 n=1 Tax=Helicoverpa armigera TaxID=29058 RepID=UPI003082D806
MASQHSSSQKRFKTWKVQSRTGGNRRKILKDYRNILNYNVADANLSQDNLNENGSITRRGQVGDLLDEGSACNGSDIATASFDISEEDRCYYSLSSDDEDNPSEYIKNFQFSEKLRAWSIEKNITQTAIKDLLLILNDRFGMILPKDPRTLLQTPKNILIKKLDDDGEYWHNGISEPLKCILRKFSNLPNTIYLNFNIDGLPIHNSSKKEFWPILANIHQVDANPFVIGVYFGIGKPKSLKLYLEDFVNETKCILQEGIQIEDKKISVKIRCFICDSPARAFIKGVCNFNGMHGCLKCTTVGEYSHRSHTVFFSSRKFPDRNNEDFRAKKYGAHHKADSPLLELPIDMVQDIPVGDSLHLIDLGIMKRLLVGWRNGNFGIYTTKWCARDITKVNEFLMKSRMPSEIHRSIRSLDCLAHWKGSEFRTFLHYLSIIVLIDVLHEDVYQHFLMFFCAATICSVSRYSTYLPIARELFQSFVDQFKFFYGRDYATSNVHNLMHVVDEVEKFGPLLTFNAYPFENKLYTIKNMLRQGNKPLIQLAKRISEKSMVDSPNLHKRSEHTEPFVSESQYRTTLHFNTYMYYHLNFRTDTA